MKKLLALLFAIAMLISTASCSDDTFVMNGEFEIEEMTLTVMEDTENARITFKMKNTTEESITEMHFLLVAYDKDGLLVQKKRLNHTFDDWESGKTNEFEEALYSSDISKADLYVYSVVFANGYTFGDAESDEETVEANCRAFSATAKTQDAE